MEESLKIKKKLKMLNNAAKTKTFKTYNKILLYKFQEN